MGLRETLLAQYERHKQNGLVDPVFRRNFVTSLPKKKDSRTGTWIEPPCVFVGRDANHPLRGTCKPGVRMCDVTVNTAVYAKASARKEGFVRFESCPDKTWKFAWYDPLFRERRYQYPGPTKTSQPKFDAARVLWKNHRKVRRAFVDPLLWYFMDTLCIRVGNDKDTRTEADTVGCCTLRAHEHVKIQQNKRVHIRFPGKDSVMFDRVVRVPPDVFQQIQARLSKTPPGGPLFPGITPAVVNRSLQSALPGCTAKQFRTMHASLLFEKTLQATRDPVLANRNVAELLNHRRKDRTLLLETSRQNYIDPRVYFSFVHSQPPGARGFPKWFQDAEWAKTARNFKF